MPDEEVRWSAVGAGKNRSEILTQTLKKSSLDLTQSWGTLRHPVPQQRCEAMISSDECLNDPATIRLAANSDLPAIARLAELDSARLPRGRVLIAELRGNVVAAISVESGVLFADPFVSTADVVKVLRAKAAAMEAADDPETRRRRTSLVARVREVRRRRRPGLRTTS
jgi:hypothetical protein